MRYDTETPTETSTPGATPTATPTLAPFDGSYAHDDNGNMTTRIEFGVEWTQGFNAENLLTSTSDGTNTWSFTYDGDNNRIRQANPNGEVTLYLGGGLFEVRDAAGDAQVVKYYTIAGQRLAMQDSQGVKYLLTDHLGSVVAITDNAGELLSEQRYKPFGEPRFAEGIGETNYGFTGQRALIGTGLMDYRARLYNPVLNRWTQPDNFASSIMFPQSLNRFSFVNNNPLKFTDPSGYLAELYEDGNPCNIKPGGCPTWKPSWTPSSSTPPTNSKLYETWLRAQSTRCANSINRNTAFCEGIESDLQPYRFRNLEPGSDPLPIAIAIMEAYRGVIKGTEDFVKGIASDLSTAPISTGVMQGTGQSINFANNTKLVDHFNRHVSAWDTPRRKIMLERPAR